MPGVVALGAIQAVRYGSPLGSGYGSFDDLFALVERRAEPGALSALDDRGAHAADLAVAARAAVVSPLLDRGARAFGWILYALRRGGVLGLPSLRVLPARRMVVHAVPAACAAADDGVDRAGAVERGAAHRCRAAPVAAAAVVCVVVARAVDSTARRRSACSACAKASRSIRASAASSASGCRATAFVMAAQHSGSVTLLLGPADPALGSARRRVARPRDRARCGAPATSRYVVLDAGEDEQFRARFGARNQQARRQADRRWRRSATRPSTASDERRAAGG